MQFGPYLTTPPPPSFPKSVRVRNGVPAKLTSSVQVLSRNTRKYLGRPQEMCRAMQELRKERGGGGHPLPCCQPSG